MPKGYNFRPLVQNIIKQSDHKRAESAVVHSLDGNHANIRIGNASTLVRNVAIVGDVSLVTVGSTVALAWIDDRPIIMSGATGGVSPSKITSSNTSVAVDNDTLERSSRGLRVKQGGIDLKHLSFTPALSGHSHKDSLQRGGWMVSDNGVLFNNRTYISPDGSFTLGEAPHIIRLSSIDETYRIWAGTQQGEGAPFSVDKYGNISATAGEIGSWTLGLDSISADNGDAELNASTPHIQLGGRSYESGVGLWVGKDVDSTYKLVVGNSTDYLLWDGAGLVLSGEIKIGATSYEVGSGFWVGDESGTYKLRIGNDTEYLRWNGTNLELSTNIAIGATGYMTGEGFWAGFDNGVPKLFIGEAESYIVWDGDSLIIAGEFASNNYVEGLSGWHLDPGGDAEFRNVSVRGSIKSSVLEYDQVLVIDGGFIATKASGLVRSDLTAISTAFDVDVNIPEGASGSDLGSYWAAGDVVRVKSGFTNFWGTIISTMDNADYWTLSIDKNEPSEDVFITAGATLINYGQSGQGAIEMIGSKPAIRMFTHTGTPYASVDNFLILGNLAGQFGVSGTTLGFGVGDPLMLADYFVATENGIQMSGEFKLGAEDYATGIGFWAGKESSVAKFRVGDPAGDFVRWDGNHLEIRGSITITGTSSGLANFGVGDLAFQNDVNWTQVTGASKPEDNATAGATWGVDLAGIPSTLQDEPTAGLHLTSGFMGYHDGLEYKTYIDNSGAFYFKGETGYIAWNPTSDKLFGHNGVAEQWYASSVDGKLYAGGGSVTLDAQGAKFIGYKSTLLFTTEFEPSVPVGTVRLDQDIEGKNVVKVINGLDASGINLITNGAFAVNITGWTISGNGVAPAWSSEQYRTASGSLEFSPFVLTWESLQDESGNAILDESGEAITVLDNDEIIEDAATSNDISIDEGEDYAVQLYAYIPDKDYYTFELYLEFYNSIDQLVRTKAIPFVNSIIYNDWNLAREFFVAQSGESYVNVKISVNQGYGVDDMSPESIYIDDVGVYALSAFNSQIELGDSYINIEADEIDIKGPTTFDTIPLLPSSNPTSDYQAATKKYVDDNSGGGDASEITFTPSVLTNWNNNADPGNVDDALDQLSSRLEALSAMGDYVVLNYGDQTIGGVKTFTSFPVTPSSNPSSSYQVANKAYVDEKASYERYRVYGGSIVQTLVANGMNYITHNLNRSSILIFCVNGDYDANTFYVKGVEKVNNNQFKVQVGGGTNTGARFNYVIVGY